MIKNRNGFLYFLVIFSSFGGLIGGYMLSVIAGAAPFIKHDFMLSSQQLSLLLGILLFGGIVSKIILLFGNSLGRKNLLIFILIVYVLGVLVFTLGHSFASLSFGRFLQGISILLSTIVFTMYVAEMSPPSIRGSMVTVFQLSWTAGILLANVINFMFVKNGNWHLMFNTVLIIPVGMLLVSFFLPESPRLLVLRGRVDEAKEVVKKIFKNLPPERLEYELSELMKNNDSKFTGLREIFFKWKYLKPFLLVTFILVFNQLMGINAILQASVIMLQDSGLKSQQLSVFGSVLISGINFVMTIFTVVLIDRIGRKTLFKLGTGVFFFTVLILSILMIILVPGKLKGTVMLFGLFIATGFFAIGPGGAVYAVLSEVIPTKIRSIGISIGGIFAYLVGAVFVSKFLIIGEKFGFGLLFLFIAIFSLIYFIFCVKLLPETNGKTLETIESDLSG